jgi:hypothetical protein
MLVLNAVLVKEISLPLVGLVIVAWVKQQVYLGKRQ